MIIGIVTPTCQAVVHLIVYGSDRAETEIEATIDTGFDAFLTLPPALIAQLGLTATSSASTTLADGSITDLAVYKIKVLWDQQERDVTVLRTDGDMLIGMSMLQGYEVRIQVTNGGSVTIEALH